MNKFILFLSSMVLSTVALADVYKCEAVNPKNGDGQNANYLIVRDRVNQVITVFKQDSRESSKSWNLIDDKAQLQFPPAIGAAGVYASVGERQPINWKEVPKKQCFVFQSSLSFKFEALEGSPIKLTSQIMPLVVRRPGMSENRCPIPNVMPAPALEMSCTQLQ